MTRVIESSRFQDQVIAPLDRIGRSLKRLVLTEGLCRCATFLVSIAAAQFFADRTLILGSGPRAALLIILLATIAIQAWHRLVRPLAARVDINDIASILERKNPGFRDHLATAVAFATGAGTNPHRDSPALVAAILRDAIDRFRTLPTDNLFRRRRHRRYLVLGLSAVAIVVWAVAVAPDTMATYVARNLLLRDVPWPISTRIVPQGFSNGQMSWPIGDDLILVATAYVHIPPSLRAEFAYADGEASVRDMDRRGRDQFILDYGPLAQAMKVRFLIGKFGVDERTDWYTIYAVPRPSVQSVRIEITPPDYASMEPFVVPYAQASADIIRGSSVRIDATLSKPIARSVLRARSDERPVAPATIRDGTHVATEFVPKRKGTFFFDVLDEDGLDDRQPVTYTFSLIPDPPPKVRLTLNGAGELVVPDAILNLAVDCEDNLGLRSVDLAIRTTRENGPADTDDPADQSEPLPDFVAGQLRYSLKRTWPLLPFTLVPGDQITLQVRATDAQPPGEIESNIHEDATPARSNLGESLAYTLRVVTTEELLAELGRREHEWRQEFEQIIKSQEQIIHRLEDLHGLSKDDAHAARRSIRYAQEARTQRQQVGRLKTVARQFEQILDELKVNQLAGPAVRRRLSGGVLRPLKRLINEDIVATAALMDRLRHDFDEAFADELEQREAKIVQTMYDILADMLKWEGYNEAVALLRDIVRMHHDVNRATEARLEREIEQLFGGDSEPKPKREPEPTTRPSSRQ